MTLRLPLPRSASYRIAIIGLLFYICALVPLGIGVSYATHAALRDEHSRRYGENVPEMKILCLHSLPFLRLDVMK